MDRRDNRRNISLKKVPSIVLTITLALSIQCLFIHPLPAREKPQTSPTIGMRVDPSYLYETHFKAAGVTDARSAAALIVQDAVKFGVNTLFFYIYNSEFGAFYPTEYPYTAVEPGFGRQNILAHLLDEARAYGLQVIGVIPVNNFFTPWKEKPHWRLHLTGNYSISPTGSYYLLSAWNEEFQKWFRGFLRDILARYPGLNGIEVVEAQIDPYGQLSQILHPQHLKTFRGKHPDKAKKNETFMQFHSRGLTRLLGIAGRITHDAGKRYYLSQTWTANKKGRLVPSEQIREACGFDFNGVLALPKKERPDTIVAELIWQQWRDKYQKKHFSPVWTLSAARQCQEKLGSRAGLIVHIEVTPWGRIVPTKEQFLQSVRLALKQNSEGVCFYDYHQLKKLNWNLQE